MQLCFDFNSIISKVIAEIQDVSVELQLHADSTFPPLPQIKAFLETSLCHTALWLLGQRLGAHVVYMGAPLGTRRHFLCQKNIETPPCFQGQSWFLEAELVRDTIEARLEEREIPHPIGTQAFHMKQK